MHPTLSHRNSQSNRRALATDPRAGNGILRRWITATIRKRRERQMIAALEALNDRTLRDIGLYRSEIPILVAGFSDRELGMSPPAPRNRTPDTDAGERVCAA